MNVKILKRKGSIMDKLINVFKIFSDETRLRIIILLAQEKFCVCQLSGILDVSQPNISKHLSKLRDVGFVSVERKEKFIFYRLMKSNSILVGIANDILNNIHKFPQLLQDQKRIAEKEQYLSQCCIHNN
jgi:ArsR family transcriptional regulator